MRAGTSTDSRRRASTQRSRKKRAKPQKRTALDAILDALPVAALHLDARETIRAVNPRAEELLGRALGENLVDMLGSQFGNLLARGEEADQGRWVVGGETLCWERGALSLGRKGEEAIVIFMSLAERRKRDAQYADLAAKVDALSRSQAVVEFGLDGRLLSANQNFLDTFGYRLDEVEGAAHRKFMPDDDARSPAYEEFWQRIRRGESVSGEFLRVGKGGREIWLQATYSPNRAADGTLLKVVKHAVDVTERKQRDADTAGQLAAIEASQAVVAFDLEGRLLHANDLFLAAVGYRLDEVLGHHHSMFVDAAERDAPAYQQFWARLRAGEHVAGEFMRIRKDGSDLWIQASYTPIRDARGRPYKVVKYASDVTKRKLHEADFSSQIAAISSSQAVVELALDGTVLCANDNFLDAVGYDIAEVRGQHHAMFVPESERRGQAYRAFWENLRAGRFVAGEFLRVGKDGREVYIQASYNPICDLRGRPYKVVKFATVVTERKRQDADYAGQIEAIRRSQAVIEFDVEGHILDANDQFLHVMGYERREVVGRHHAMFVARHEQQSETYRRFWRDLGEGRSASGEFARIASDGREVFIQATYTPIRDERGRVFKVVKFATDVSLRKYKDRAIARHAAEATNAAQAAVSTASSTNLTVEQLGVSTHDVAKVLDVITAIARQTKLLALNATIEAARAGEAGKGFAVVAHEVKELAAETARATEDVGQKIQAIQGAARAVVSAISEIGASIDQVNAIQSSIAQAVEEQAQTSSAVAHGGGARSASAA